MSGGGRQRPPGPCRRPLCFRLPGRRVGGWAAARRLWQGRAGAAREAGAGPGVCARVPCWPVGTLVPVGWHQLTALPNGKGSGQRIVEVLGYRVSLGRWSKPAFPQFGSWAEGGRPRKDLFLTLSVSTVCTRRLQILQ